MLVNGAAESVRLPVFAQMRRHSEGRYRIAEAEYDDVPFDAVVRIFWQAYRADQTIIRRYWMIV